MYDTTYSIFIKPMKRKRKTVPTVKFHCIEQKMVRFLDPDGDHDKRTLEVIDCINATGNAWFGPTVWHRKCVMRISMSNFRTTREDVDRMIAEFEKLLSI